MAKWTYEQLKETMVLIWEGYMRDEFPQEDGEMMVKSALQVAGWSAEEYDAEVITRSVDKPGCRRIVERGTN